MTSISAGSLSSLATKSSLLQFAFEMRQNIYSFVLPKDISIHIQEVVRPVLDRTVQDSKGTPEPRFWWFLACDGEIEEGEFHMSCGGACKRCCYPHDFEASFKDQQEAIRRWKSEQCGLFCSMAVDLKILRTCRQIRTEASQVLFQANRFHFPKEIQLSAFLDMPCFNFSAMRSVSIVLGEWDSNTINRRRNSTKIKYQSPNNPRRLLDHVEELITKLPGITELTVYAVWHGDPPWRYVQFLQEDEALFLSLRMLSQLPLEDASVRLTYVSVSDDER